MLTIVATPLGNLGDLSERALAALRGADLWIVEDTRVGGKLQQAIGAKAPMAVLNEHTPPGKLSALASRVLGTEHAVLTTDAGTPCISDPGSLFVEACRELGIEVDAVPGPSAVTLALSLSGFFAQRFAFLGYLPRKPGPMREVLLPFTDSPLTLVLFESPYRLDPFFKVANEVLGSRRYAICRELTKKHQQVHLGRLSDVPDERQVPRKGEFTVVIEGMRRSTDSHDCSG